MYILNIIIYYYTVKINCMSIWVTGKIVKVKYWTDQLFTIIVHAPINTFIAGQFTRIRIKINDKAVQRAYSYLNAPNNSNLEFYINTISGGKFTPHLRSCIAGSTLMLSKKSYGRFILDEIPNCENLWMLATGTGIAPYLSILEHHDSRLNKFLNIILVHATRFSKNLNYLFKMIQLQKIYSNKLHIETILSQEKSINSLYGRISNLIENNLLEKKIGLNFNAKNSHVMLCGNPDMICDTKKILYKKYSMKDHLKFNPGHITQERYW